MELFHPALNNYAEQYTTNNDERLEEIYTRTLQSHPHAHLQSSFVQGKLLEFLSTMLRPKYILEIGTFTGYSAICLAKGLAEGGQLHTIELREETADIASANFELANMNNFIYLHVGSASAIIPDLPYKWDMVFIDADKTGYIEYYEMALERLSENGVIIADNVLFHGQVLEDPVHGKNAKAVAAFNKYVKEDNRTEQVLLTLRDGLMLIKKK